MQRLCQKTNKSPCQLWAHRILALYPRNPHLKIELLTEDLLITIELIDSTSRVDKLLTFIEQTAHGKRERC